jgi:hypothetical protein
MGRIIGRVELIEAFRRRPRVREGQSAALATHNAEGPAEVRQTIFGNEDCFMARIAAIWAIHALHFNRIGLSRTRTRAEYPQGGRGAHARISRKGSMGSQRTREAIWCGETTPINIPRQLRGIAIAGM